MNDIELIPLEGIVINGTEIKLGASEKEVKDVLGEPSSKSKSSLYFFRNELRFDLDNGKVRFIEFLGGIDGKLQPMIYGVPAFQTDADKMYDILKRKNNGAIDDSEAEYGYGFCEISVGVYREITPYDVQQMIADDSSVNDEDISEQMRRAEHWEAIGIGVKNYYNH